MCYSNQIQTFSPTKHPLHCKLCKTSIWKWHRIATRTSGGSNGPQLSMNMTRPQLLHFHHIQKAPNTICSTFLIRVSVMQHLQILLECFFFSFFLFWAVVVFSLEIQAVATPANWQTAHPRTCGATGPWSLFIAHATKNHTIAHDYI